MFKIEKRFIIIIVLLSLIFTSSIAFANSTEPPRFIIVGNNLPEDLKIEIHYEYDDGSSNFTVLEREDKFWETYYRAYYIGDWDKTETNIDILLNLDGEITRLNYPDISNNSYAIKYNTYAFLDLESKTLSAEDYAIRTYFLIGLRVILTLIIEGIVFYLFGYREKISYIIFIVVNLITQGFLNYSFSGLNLSYVWWILFVLIEIVIFIVEYVVLSKTIKEEGKIGSFVLVANFLSLVIGGFIISTLPI